MGPKGQEDREGMGKDFVRIPPSRDAGLFDIRGYGGGARRLDAVVEYPFSEHMTAMLYPIKGTLEGPCYPYMIPDIMVEGSIPRFTGGFEGAGAPRFCDSKQDLPTCRQPRGGWRGQMKEDGVLCQ